MSKRSLKWQYDPNHMVSDTIFWTDFWTPWIYELLVEICIRSMEGQYGLKCNVSDTVF